MNDDYILDWAFKYIDHISTAQDIDIGLGWMMRGFYEEMLEEKVAKYPKFVEDAAYALIWHHSRDKAVDSLMEIVRDIKQKQQSL